MVEAVEPKTLSFVVTDLRTRRLAGIKKEILEEILKTAGIPARYFYQRSFATWDVLLAMEELAKKLAGSNITTKFFWFQLEYRGQRGIKVTTCNVYMQRLHATKRDVPTAYLSKYGGVEDVIQIRSTSGTTYGDYSFIMYVDRGGFQAIPHTISYKDQTMIVVVELGHFAQSCPQKTTTSTTTKTAVETIAKQTEIKETNQKSTNLETGDRSNKEEGRTQVTHKGGKK